MARGASQSQASSSSSARPGTVGIAPRGSAAATAGMRRRRLGGTSGGSSGGFSAGGSGSNMLRFYTDDAPGLKITPTVVLVMSLCFIGFVTALHVFGRNDQSVVLVACHLFGPFHLFFDVEGSFCMV